MGILNQCAGTLKDSDEMAEKSDPHILTLKYPQGGTQGSIFPCSVFLQEPDRILEPLHNHSSLLCCWMCCRLWTVVVGWDLHHWWLVAL